MAIWIILAALSLVAIAWFIIKKLGSPESKARVLLAAYRACKESGASEDECLFQMLDTRPPWRSLPKPFLRELATRLRTRENITNFVIFSEGTGVLQTNILGMPAAIEYDQEIAIGGVALALISRANAFVAHSHFPQAKNALEWALLLKPNTVIAWSSMAMVAFQMKDYQTAVYWAEKVLNFVPNPASDDIWEGGAADLMAPGGYEKAAQLLGEPVGTDTWKQVQEQMEAIRKECRQ